MPRMVIANRLRDGLVVFFERPGSWVENIEAGTLLDDGAADAALTSALADEQRCLVIDPNLIDVAVVDGSLRPTAIREAIRAFGPSEATRTDLL